MFYLVLVSIIWAFSFGLFKGHLTGLDPNLTAFLRLLIALPVFLPFLRLEQLKPSGKTASVTGDTVGAEGRAVSGSRARSALALMGIGAVQYGVMYSALNASYHWLHAWQVALFTVFTPIYVTLINDLWDRQFHAGPFRAAIVAMAGAAIIMHTPEGNPFAGAWGGFALVQVSNLAFAAGQVAYKRMRPELGITSDYRIYALPYVGAILITAVAATATGGWPDLLEISHAQAAVLVYLGILASGFCFFWWNKGATLVQAGTLAVMNNVKIPLAVLCSLLFFGEDADIRKLAIGAVALGMALWMTLRK